MTHTPERAESWRICIWCCRPKQVLVPDLESAIGLDVLTARQGESDRSNLHHDSFGTQVEPTGSVRASTLDASEGRYRRAQQSTIQRFEARHRRRLLPGSSTGRLGSEI